MDTVPIKSGSIIQGPYWPEPVLVNYSVVQGEFIRIVGATQRTRNHVDQLISLEEVPNIQILTAQPLFTEEAWKVFLALETIRYRYASSYDPLLAMNVSKVDPLPHQLEAVYGYVLKLPRIRFLIADDPGAGKTIMAGLIIKELKLRQVVKRILIVAPGHLNDQWKRELKERFDEDFSVIDRSSFDSVYKTNVWEKENQSITSIDFAKKEDFRRTLAATRFDLVIVDEAHKMSAYKYNEKVDKSERYKLGEVLYRITEHLLFLTATPHKGDPENFRLFLDLLEPGFFATEELVQQSIQNKDNPLFIRRIKEDLRDFEGKPLFLPRHVKTVHFALGILSPQEKTLYNDLSQYVEQQYNLALSKTKKRNIAFALVILQRRLASSVYALLKSLERRKKKLEDLLRTSIWDRVETIEDQDLDELEDLSEEDRWEKESEWEGLSVAETREELEREIQTIHRLIVKASEIIQHEGEAKLRKLKESLEELSHHVPEKEKRKILIFTESRDTLEYLEKKVREWGYSVNTIHGGMKLEDRVQAETVFRNQTDILVATEAAGEGINLQFCNLMINYDIPWNPNRLEQRMGRIHRYGQTREVFVHNLVASDTREGRVLTRLFEKLDEIRHALGTDKVFDVLGELIDSKRFSQAMLEAAVNARSIDEILKTWDMPLDEQYLTQLKENLGETLATRYIDYTQIQEMAQKAKEHRLIPEYTRSFFIKAFERAGGKIRNLKFNLMAIDQIPYALRSITEDEAFKKTYGSILRTYSKVTFDKEVSKKYPTVEFVSFGHPLFEAVLQWVEKSFLDTLYTGATFYDPDGNLDGYILFYEGEVRDGTGNVAGKRLFSFFVGNQKVKSIPPSILWDLAEGTKEEKHPPIDSESLKNQVYTFVVTSLTHYKQELAQERSRQAAIKQKYGIQSLEYLIVKLDEEILGLEIGKERGENVARTLQDKRERKTEYERALEDLKQHIKQEQSLSISSPRFLGMIRVMPLPGKVPEMATDPHIEAIGMRVAMEYEQRNGRTPVDVSSQNLGFDIKSVDSEGKTRYIEVKARAQTGSVALTQNEWFKAQRFGDEYYLYVVFHASTYPELHIIPNPSATLHPEEKVEIVRYLIDGNEILHKGIKG